MRCPSMSIVAGFENASVLDAASAIAPVARMLRRLSGCGLFMFSDLVSVIGVALGNDLFDLVPQSTEQALLRVRSHQLALAVDRAFSFSPGDAHVRHLGLARSVDDAAHDGDLDGRLVFLGKRLDALG